MMKIILPLGGIFIALKGFLCQCCFCGLSNFSIQYSFRISLEVTDIIPFYGIDKTKNPIAKLRDFNIVEKSY